MYSPWTQWTPAGGAVAYGQNPYGPFQPGRDPGAMDEALLDTDRTARAWGRPNGFDPIQGGQVPADYRGNPGPRPMSWNGGFGPTGVPVPFVPTEVASPPFGGDFRIDPRLILEEIRRCGRGLQTVSEGLDGKDSSERAQAHLAATRYLFYTLGLLFSRGVILSPEIHPGETTETASTSGAACKAAGQSIERFVRQQLGGRSTGTELSDLVVKLRECWEHLTQG